MLVAIEDLLLARAQAALGTTVHACAPLPGGLGQLAAILRKGSLVPPVVFCAWRGSQRPAGKVVDGRLVGPAGLHVTSEWSLLAVTQDPAGETARRRGDAVRGTIGGAQIAVRLGLALHDLTLTGYGTLAVHHLGPIDSELLTEMDVTITEVRVGLSHDLGTGLDLTGLDDFLCFAADYIAATDELTLAGAA